MKDYANYYDNLKAELRTLRKGIPGTARGFGELHKAATAEGAVSTKHKELIAIGIAIAIRCDACITFHIKDALRAGASMEEMLETIGVAVLMGGGPAMMYGCQALSAIKQFMEEKVELA